ncbi:hypothetical protein OsJ_09751 [Oryza sativa Japonica Group]|uniref:Uncharacterized protein n=1 Tax=Oryza sativa subsp. japonica TaxID=39947 RepID=B9F5N6_ORYSJ|nr:hypothetical protein OsJ_09751 [Oryza sativa Japonica Group]
MVLHESLDGAGVSTVHARANGDPSISTATPATNHLISPPPLHSPPPFAGDNPTFGTTGSSPRAAMDPASSAIHHAATGTPRPRKPSIPPVTSQLT